MLSASQARRIALAAQGFADRPPAGSPDRRTLRRVLDRVGLFQIDSVNVLVRSHYLPLYSRAGPYPRPLLDRAADRAPRLLFEYWGHEASYLPVRMQPLLRWRMARAHQEAWGGMRAIAREDAGFVDWVRAEVAEKGPLTAREIESDRPRRTGPWWGWSDLKRALEWLFWCGEVTSAGRRGFERCYDLPERVLPSAVVTAPTPAPADAQRELVRIAARACGVAAERDLRDYFRLGVAETRARVAELVEDGELLPVATEGWGTPAYLHREARLPRRVGARALLSPFDSAIWDRGRTARVFGFRYRLEIYTPAAARVHGYYVLPFLLGDRLVARVDLRADRRSGTLQVQGAYAEPTAPPDVAPELGAELATLAGWLGLDTLEVAGRGDLAPALQAAVRVSRPLRRSPTALVDVLHDAAGQPEHPRGGEHHAAGHDQPVLLEDQQQATSRERHDHDDHRGPRRRTPSGAALDHVPTSGSRVPQSRPPG